MSLVEVAGLSLLAILGYMAALWVVSLILRNASIVDVFWGAGFLLAAVVYFLATDGFTGRKVLATALVAVWGTRLSLHILWRNWGKGEDFRYRRWRERAGARFWWTSLFQVFLLQGLLLWIISTPLLAAQFNDDPDRFAVTDFVGSAVWGIGFFFESVGDWQLARFKRDPENEGKVMRAGLWAYTRHPNYFGDATLWWGYFIIAAGTPYGWLTAFSPAIMTTLLLRVSGVALLERTLKETRPQYRDYMESTSAFLPWFPAKGSGAGRSRA